MKERKIRAEITGDTAHTAYIYLPGRPERITPGIVAKSIDLSDLIEDYKGPWVNLHFNNESLLIGIEILARVED